MNQKFLKKLIFCFRFFTTLECISNPINNRKPLFFIKFFKFFLFKLNNVNKIILV